MSSPGNTEVKVNKPFVFTGKSADTLDWIRTVELYCFAHNYATNASRIVVALSYMAEAAAPFAQQEVDKYITKQQAVPEWTEWVKMVKNQFLSADESLNAAHALERLPWKNGEHWNFLNAFTTLANRSGLDDLAIKIILMKRVPMGLAQKVIASGKDQDTWQKWLKAAIDIEETSQGLFALRPQRRFNRVRATNEQDDDTQDIRANRPALTKLTPQERERLQREGRCFRCRETGHISRNCPQNTRNRFRNSNRIREVREDSGSAENQDTSKNDDAMDVDDVVKRVQHISIEDRDRILSALTKDFA